MKIVINGVDGNFGSSVVEKIETMIDKSSLVLTAPKEEVLKPYRKKGFNVVGVSRCCK